MTRQIINFLQSKNKKYLLVVPTGIAAQNIDGKTIYSSLKIRFWKGSYETLALSNPADVTELKKIEAFIIGEVSMVDGDLFMFVSNIFAKIHKNNLIFGGIPTLVIGDLAQLSPVHPSQIRTGNLSVRSKQIIQTKINQETDLCSFYDTTHVVGTQKAATIPQCNIL
ncbi:23160_t:CDS:2 [Entrophospora sp. SA101]|nr:23160_t:CDS:2 [Entrophospora sp. SA101]